MNWLHFFFWITGIYVMYYLVVILLDIANNKSAPGITSPVTELTFMDEIKPQKPEYLPDQQPQTKAGTMKTDTGITMQRAPEMVASGGVSFREMLTLARQEAIVYTKAVSF